MNSLKYSLFLQKQISKFKHQRLFGCKFFITQFLSLITHYSSLITHHLKYPTRLAPSLNIFHTVYGPHTCHSVQLFFFPVPKLTEPNEKKRKKETQKPEPSERRRKKKQELKTEPRKRKGKKMVKMCDYGSLHVCLITKVSLNYD